LQETFHPELFLKTDFLSINFRDGIERDIKRKRYNCKEHLILDSSLIYFGI